MLDFLSGICTGGFLVAALFFFRFWKRTHDRLFALFGLAFVLFAINQIAILLSHTQREDLSWIYLFRLAGFLLLLGGILGKNFSRLPKR